MNPMERRVFLQGAGMGVLAFTVGGASVMMTPRDARAQGVPFRLLKAHEAGTIEAVGETLVPGARQAGVAHFIDQQVCPRDAAINTGTCLPSIHGVGLSAVGFSFDRGQTWHQPAYTGWTNFDALDPLVTSNGHVGPIHTLPWYYEAGLVSEGDPAVAFGPRPDANGHFSWANGSRLYYANLVGTWNPTGNDIIFPGDVIHQLIGLAV